MNHLVFKFSILTFLSAGLVACGKNLSDANNNGGGSTPATEAEISFCSTSTLYSPGVAVSGTAKFLRRGLNLQINSSTVTSATTGAVISTSLPIKYAEIRVLSGSSIIQCGTTNALGELRALDGSSPLFLPNEAGNFTIEVLARANYTFPSVGKPTSSTLSVAVKEDIYSNAVHKISGTYISNGFGGNNSTLNLVAQASEVASSKIEGGAFNIYNDWVTAFEYLTSTSNTGSQDVSCLNQRLDMFWKAGFNPYEYVEASTDTTLSFYLRDDYELFICGGQNGDVTMADTDHWDDAVILHEMGHHIENVCGRADSPGGAHYAQYRVDPRLAWSEGFGNFMGAHIIKNNTAKINPALLTSLPNSEWLFYHDTIGYLDGGAPTMNHQLILMRLNKPGSGAGVGSSHDIVYPASFPGESHFREASIARGLFKGANTCSANCGGGVGFDKYWTALGRTVNGMGQSNSPFSSSAKFFAKAFAANGNTFSTSMTTIMISDESLHMAGSASYTVTANSTSSGSVSTNAWPSYGVKLTTNSSCNRALLQARNTSKTFADFSDQRYSNHFYTIRKSDLTGVTSIRIEPDSTCPVDLDLIVYNQVYAYGEDCSDYNTIAGVPYCSAVAKAPADSYVAVQTRSSLSNDQVSLSSLSSTSFYLLNVRGYYADPSNTPNSSCVYRLKDQNGATLCPSTSY